MQEKRRQSDPEYSGQISRKHGQGHGMAEMRSLKAIKRGAIGQEKSCRQWMSDWEREQSWGDRCEMTV